ncbi:MAG: hypothetical protein EKK55_16295 [Rhodocyclaceae bacterium]|nr:MAG: hypothetical protein EKK55_16295 [Rhodocyclaceae bacterium]
MAQSRPAPWRERLDEAAHGWALLMSDAMVAGSIGAPPGEFGAFLLRGERDLESQRDTEAARWVQVRGEARAVPVRESAEVLLGMLRDPDGRNRLKAAQFIQERVGGLAPPAPVQVTVSQAVAVAPATGPGVVVSALNAAFQRRLEAEAQAQVVEVAG